MKKYVLVATLAIGTGFLAAGAHAEGFHGHHGGGSPIGSCIAVMSSAQRANLKNTFKAQEQTLRTDRQNLATARQALTAAIVSGSKDVTAQETALSSAELQMQKDRDALAMQICGQLSPIQLGAAKTLNTNLANLRQSTHQQAHSYIQNAKAASNAGPANAE